MSLAKELAELLNKHSVEGASGTPDYILSHYLLGSLNVFQEAVNQRAEWRGESGAIPLSMTDSLHKKKVPLVDYTDGRRNEIGEAEIELWPGEVRVHGTITGVIPMLSISEGEHFSIG